MIQVDSLTWASVVAFTRREKASAKSSCFSTPNPTSCSIKRSQPCRGNLTTPDLIEVEVKANRVRLSPLGFIAVASTPWSSYNHQLVCEEKFGDYVRVDPALGMYFCYLRRDIGFSVSNYLDENTGFKKTLQGSIGGIDGSEMLSQTSLRLTVVPFCNFNCRTPGQTHGWCMEEPGEYRYPPIKPTLIQLKR